MFGTIIVDAYRESEARDIASALDELCNPSDNWGWSSAGVYCFWKYADREVLYIGLARDFTERFRQHNGQVPYPAGSCKRERIAAYFAEHERLGFSIVAQSPYAQPVGRRFLESFGTDSDEVAAIYGPLGAHGLEGAQILEGKLIEAFRQHAGRFPAWNERGGSVAGQAGVEPLTAQTLEVLTSKADSLMRARLTLRRLAADSTAMIFESHVHAARMLAAALDGDVIAAMRMIPDSDGSQRRMADNGYLYQPAENP